MKSGGQGAGGQRLREETGQASGAPQAQSQRANEKGPTMGRTWQLCPELRVYNRRLSPRSRSSVFLPPAFD